MKKFLLVILCLTAVWTLTAQQVSWGVPFKLKEKIFSPNTISAGNYLGTINGSDYYAEYTNHAGFLKFDDAVFTFYQTKGNNITKVSDLTELKYDVLDAGIMDDQISVLHIKGTKTEKRQIKIDLYNPTTFRKGQTISVFSFQPLNKNPYINFVKSEDQEYNCIVMNGKHPDSGVGTLIIKCYDKKYNEVWTHYFDYNGSGYPEIGDMILSNTGDLVIHFFVYESDKKKSLRSFDFVEFNPTTYEQVTFSVPSKKMEVVDYKMGQYGSEHQYLFVYTEEENVTGVKVDFNNDSAGEIFTNKPYKGYWKVDKIVDLENGKYTVALQNRNMTEITIRQNNGFTSTTYYWWNRSFQFIGLNSETDEIMYKKMVGRKYNVIQPYYAPEPYISVTPFYFAKNGELNVVYNTDKKTVDNESNAKEKPVIIAGFAKSTTKPLTKMITISETGKATVKTLFDEKTTKLTFLSRFTHLNDNDELIIALGKKKKMMVGKMKL